MRRYQTAHETLIPLLVDIIGAQSYLEFGTHLNETIGRVSCPRKFGVDISPKAEPGIVFFKMTTAEFIENHAWQFGPFDFVFIDADHSEAAVCADFDGIWPHVSTNGIICLHDMNPETVADTAPGYCGDGWKFAKTLDDGGYEMVVLPYHPGLAIIRKRVGWGPK